MYSHYPLGYILIDREPVLFKGTLDEWIDWFNNPENRRIRISNIGGVAVSTVFLGYDHSLVFPRSEHRPLLFETMIFGGDCDGYKKKYYTYDEAVQGHEQACSRVLSLIPN